MPELIRNNVFYFTKSNRRGIVFFICLAAIIFAFPYLKSWVSKPVPKNIEQSSAQLIAALRQLQPDTAKRGYQQYDNFATNNRPWERDDQTNSGTLFYFDPNTLSAEGWQKLGIKEKTALGIRKYVDKGGRFKTADDIKKIWGIPPYMQQKLLPYVAIDEALLAKNDPYQPKQYQNTYPERKPYEPKKIAPININTGDSAAFESLPGIGAGYAGRIVRFRNRLGGFTGVEQVAETFGLPDSVYQKVKPFLQGDAGGIKRININSATNEELSAHPYIRWQLAKVIIAYRTQHGAFSSVDKLSNIMTITPETLNKMRPYLTIE